MKFGMV